MTNTDPCPDPCRVGGASAIKRLLLRLLTTILCLLALFGCGGGGGGAPPADVTGRILLVSTGQPPNPPATVEIGGARVTTGVDGTFLFRPPSDATQITVSGQNIKTLTQPIPTLQLPPVLNDLGDIFVLEAGSTDAYNANVSGRVVRSDNLEPINGATVTLSGLRATTGADGAFRFTGLPVGLGGTNQAVGLIRAQGFENKPIVLDLPLGPSPPDNNLGDIPLSPPVGGIPGGPTNIRGTITLQGRTDFGGTTVTLIDKSNGQTLATRVTLADGKYGFWVIAGTYTLKAEQAGFKTQTKDVTLARPDQPQTVDMTLIP